LMLRSFQRLRSVDPGFNPNGVLTLGVSAGDGVSRVEATARYQRIAEEAAALPGVTHVGLINALPLDPEGMNGGSFELESRPRAEGELPSVAYYSAISPGYFEAIGTPLLQGRPMERADIEERRPVAWVSETFARDFLGGEAIGARVRFATVSDWSEIVGVVRDVRTFGLREPIRPMVYVPMTEPIGTMQVSAMTLVLRTSGDPAGLAPAARAAVQRADPTIPITTARTMPAVVRESMADTAFTTTVLMIAAIVALLLGAIGLYGVIGYVVTQRTQEIGVRIAIGARPEQVRTMVLREGLVLAFIGIAIGTIAAAALTRGLESALYEVSRLDPLTFVVVPVVLLLTSAIAAYVPARRAAGIAPLEALRTERPGRGGPRQCSAHRFHRIFPTLPASAGSPHRESRPRLARALARAPAQCPGPTDMIEIFKAAIQRGASDIHMKAGDFIRARINGELLPLTQQRLTPDQVEQICKQLIPHERDREQVHMITDYDCSWGAPGIGRFRVNILRQRGTLMVVMRVIPIEVPT